MDRRLDFYNTVSEYNAGLTDDDTLLVINYNKKDGDIMICQQGEWDVLAGLLSSFKMMGVEDRGFASLQDARDMFLHVSHMICAADPGIAEEFYDKIKLCKP